MNQINDPNTEDADLAGFEAPEDDFDASADVADIDADGAVDDADFQDVGEDIDTDVFGEEQPSEQPAKKKFNWFNIGVAVVALAVAGGLIWSKLGPQLMGSGDDAAQMAASAPVNPGTDVNKVNSQAAAQAALGGTAAPAAGLLDNPDQFATLNQMPAPEVPAPSNAVGDDPFAVLQGQKPLGAAVPMPTPISGTPSAAPIASMPAPVATTAPEQAKAAPVTPVATESVAPLPVQTVAAASSEDSAALKAQVSALEQKLEALDSKISTAVEQMASAGNGAVAAAPVDDTRLTNIQSALERLESRLDDLASKRAAAPVQVSAVDDSAPAPKKTVKKSAKPKKASGSTAKWDEPYSPPAERTAAPALSQPVSVNASGWELRGAQTGRAVIAKGQDMREVSVGETVLGLGEITGIATMGGRWVVQGTQGRLSQ